MNKYLKNTIFITCLLLLISSFFVFSVSINPVFADDGIVPDGGKATGDYTLNDFVQIAVNVAQWILGIVGSLALLFFIYGGFMFLISAGSQERVTQAKQIIVGATIGIIIVFTSYMIIDFTMTALGYTSAFGKWNIIK